MFIEAAFIKARSWSQPADCSKRINYGTNILWNALQQLRATDPCVKTAVGSSPVGETRLEDNSIETTLWNSQDFRS